MVEVYRVGVSLLMDQGIGRQLTPIIEQFEKLDGVVKNINSNLKSIAAAMERMNAAASGIGGVGVAAEKMATAAASVSRTMPDVTRQAEATAIAMERAAAATQRLAGPSPMLALPAPNYGRTEFPSGSAYGGPQVGFTMGEGSGPRSTWTRPPGYSAGALSPYAPAQSIPPFYEMPELNLPSGFGGGGGGGGIMSSLYTLQMGEQLVHQFFDGLIAVIDKAKALNTEITRLHTVGVGETDRKAIEDIAFTVAKLVPGREVASIVADVRHLRGAMGEEVSGDPFAQIKLALPTIEMAAVALKNQTGETSDSAMQRLIKIVELRGDLVDPKTHEISQERFTKGVEAAYRALAAANGLAGTGDFFNLVKQAGPAIRMIDDPNVAWASVLAPLIDQGGSRTGTGLTAGMRQFMGGIMVRHYAEEMQELGIVKPGEQFQYTTPFHGRNAPGILKKDAIPEDQMQIIQHEGFFAWSQKILEADLARKHITSASDINKESYRLFSTETFRRLMTLYTSNAQQVVRDAKMMEKVPPLSETMKILNAESLGHNEESTWAAFNNMMAAKVEKSLPFIIPAFHGVRSFFEFETDLARGKVPTRNLLLPPGMATGSGMGDADSIHNIIHWLHEKLGGVTPPPADQRPITLHGNVMLDGKAIGQLTAHSMADHAELPSSAPTGGSMMWNLTPQPGEVVP